MHQRLFRCRLTLRRLVMLSDREEKTINALIERTDVKIDITDDGNVSICGEDADKMAEAKRLIEVITTDYYEGPDS